MRVKNISFKELESFLMTDSQKSISYLQMELRKFQKAAPPFYCEIEQGWVCILWSGQDDQSVLSSNEQKIKKQSWECID
jgi:hypothetical protein